MRRLVKVIFYFAVATVITWQLLPEKYSLNFPIKRLIALDEQQTLDDLTIQKGLTLSVYATGVTGARTLVTTPKGDLLVAQTSEGIISLLTHNDNNNERANSRKVLLKNLHKPHGMALHDGWLYIAETDSVFRIRYDDKQRQLIGSADYIIKNKFPAGGNHWRKSIQISPDDKLFVSIGSSCNTCIESSKYYASLYQYDLDGSNEQLFASGLRNTEGFDWHPQTQQLYGVDNGRDFLGDNAPPEELNLIQAQQHYGWPYLHGQRIKDPDYFKRKPAQLLTRQPIHLLPAHSAPLSLLFIKHNSILKNKALVGLHGSWNRSQRSGYKVVVLSIDNDKVTSNLLISGFENSNEVIGRPVNLAEDLLGNIYLSDDFNGRIFKITTSSSH